MRLKEHKTIKENMESKMGFQRGESWSSGRVGTTFGGMLPAQKKKKKSLSVHTAWHVMVMRTILVLRRMAMKKLS